MFNISHNLGESLLCNDLVEGYSCLECSGRLWGSLESGSPQYIHTIGSQECYLDLGVLDLFSSYKAPSGRGKTAGLFFPSYPTARMPNCTLSFEISTVKVAQ